jgi:hypothetical protein
VPKAIQTAFVKAGFNTIPTEFARFAQSAEDLSIATPPTAEDEDAQREVLGSLFKRDLVLRLQRMQQTEGKANLPELLLEDSITETGRALITKLSSKKLVGVMGVSGCGKTRALCDVAKQQHAFYFEAGLPGSKRGHHDVRTMASMNLSADSQQNDKLAQRRFGFLIAARALRLLSLGEVSPLQWLEFQRDNNEGILLSDFLALEAEWAEWSTTGVLSTATRLVHACSIVCAAENTKIPVLLDEAHCFLRELSYRPAHHRTPLKPKKNKAEVKDEECEGDGKARPLLSILLDETAGRYGCPTAFAGTELRLAEVMSSQGAVQSLAGKFGVENCSTFERFPFLTEEQALEYVAERLTLPDDAELLGKLGTKLAGRMRFCANFVAWVYETALIMGRGEGSEEKFPEKLLPEALTAYEEFFVHNSKAGLANYVRDLLFARDNRQAIVTRGTHSVSVAALLQRLWLAASIGGVAVFPVEADVDLVNACLCHLVRADDGSFAWKVGEEFVLAAITAAMRGSGIQCPQLRLFDDLVSTLGSSCSAKGNVWELVLAKALHEVSLREHRLFQGVDNLPSWWNDVKPLSHQTVLRQTSPAGFSAFLGSHSRDVLLLPSQMAGPDLIAFSPSLVTVASKLYGKPVGVETHAHNTKTSDPVLCYTNKTGTATSANCGKLRREALAALGSQYKGALRFVVSMPSIVKKEGSTVQVVSCPETTVQLDPPKPKHEAKLGVAIIPKHDDIIVTVDRVVLGQLLEGTTLAREVNEMLGFLYGGAGLKAVTT